MMTFDSKTYDAERAFYAAEDIIVKNCSFDGPADGESAFKECKNIISENCYFNLRYPFWHDDKVVITDCNMTELCRAALWYSEDVEISKTKMHGIKALRECKNIKIDNCDIVSPEFGWFNKNVEMKNSTAVSEYFFMRSKNIKFENVDFTGKYSFQYIKNATFENCTFNTKDAFWHAENVVVKNCTVNGEYLAWYSENVTFENCKISGTQPLCYCKGLKLIGCELNNADLCFEKSEVEATITTPVISIKNVKEGKITVPAVNEIIADDKNANGVIVTLDK